MKETPATDHRTLLPVSRVSGAAFALAAAAQNRHTFDLLLLLSISFAVKQKTCDTGAERIALIPVPAAKHASLYMRITALAAVLAVSTPAAAQQIKYGEQPGAKERNTLLLRDFQPTTMLHAPENQPRRARFPVWDVHNHVDDARGIGERIPPDQLIRSMDEVNVQKIVILTGGWGEDLQRVLDSTVKMHPDRFIVFAQLDWSKVNDPNFSQKMVLQLDDAVRRGARGLKVLKDLGLEVRDAHGRFLRVDDPRLDPVWEECGRLGIPVAIHTSDPEAFFTPLDKHNERYEELMENPSWSFYDHGFPSKQELLEERNRAIERHPRTTFIALHVANWPENLDAVSAWLDRYPNMMIEFGARQAELGRQPRRTREFFLKYQDRIMFGTDAEPVPAMYQNYFRWLETEDEYFDYWGYPGQGRWKIYGEGLPDAVLEKIYHLNAERVFAQFKNIASGEISKP
jgi:predicted TIM-barrel fold metal-dependent hydrolase